MCLKHFTKHLPGEIMLMKNKFDWSWDVPHTHTRSVETCKTNQKPSIHEPKNPKVKMLIC